MTRRPAIAMKTKARKRERVTRAATARRPQSTFAASVTKLGMQLFTLVRLGYGGDAPLFAAHLKGSTNAMGILAARLPAQPL